MPCFLHANRGKSSASAIANSGGLSGTQAPQAKPQQAVAFTKIEYIEGQPTTVPAGPGGYATYAFCPTGSVPVGGGFKFIGSVPGAVPYISQSSRVTAPSNDVGWGVGIANSYPGATTVVIAATVLCAS
jgi:hypothetical protein